MEVVGMRVKNGGCKFKVGVKGEIRKLFKGAIFFFWKLGAAC